MEPQLIEIGKDEFSIYRIVELEPNKFVIEKFSIMS